MTKTSRKPQPAPVEDFGKLLNRLAFRTVDQHDMATMAKRDDGKTWIVTPIILAFQGQDAEKQAKEAFERLRPSEVKARESKPRARADFNR